MIPAPPVSVIIPLFNAEFYLKECLDSLAGQSLDNFELILVDDNSADDSLKIAESYLEKFGTRLKIYANRQNLGAVASRNLGLTLATADYVFFMDADDMLLPDGLEKMYALGKNCGADVVNVTGSYRLSDDGQNLTAYRAKTLRNDEPYIEESLAWRVKGLLKNKFVWAPWRKLIRRDFLLDNRIFFPEKIRRNMDIIWTCGILFRAKRIIHAPLKVYFYRQSSDSITRVTRTTAEQIASRINSLVHALEWLNAVMTPIQFFDDNPQLKCSVLLHIAGRFLGKLSINARAIPSYELFLIVKDVLAKEAAPLELTVAALCTIFKEDFDDH